MRKQSMWFPNRSNTNQAVQAQDLESRGIVLSCSKNKGADQLHSYHLANLCLCFPMYAKCGFLMTLLI